MLGVPLAHGGVDHVAHGDLRDVGTLLLGADDNVHALLHGSRGLGMSTASIAPVGCACEKLGVKASA